MSRNKILARFLPDDLVQHVLSIVEEDFRYKQTEVAKIIPVREGKQYVNTKRKFVFVEGGVVMSTKYPHRLIIDIKLL